MEKPPLTAAEMERIASLVTAQLPANIAAVRGEVGERPIGADTIRKLLAMAHVATDANNASVADAWRAQGRRFACARGCSWCCYQHVFVTPPEAFLLAEALTAVLGEDDLEAVRVACRDTARRIAAMGQPARYALRIPCPALKDGECRAYEARPMACRTHFSLSKVACGRDWDRRGREVPGKAGVPMPDTPKSLGVAMMLGIEVALDERGLEIEQVELSGALTVALEPGAFDRWLAGERVFAAAGLGRPGYRAILEELRRNYG